MNSDNRKVQRINSDIFRCLTIAVQQKMNGLDGVQILRVETTADLSEAKIYYTADNKPGAAAALEKSSGFLRNEIAQSVKMKQVPKLRFLLDKGVENAARVEELLGKINKTN